jgi:hypothetical protein
VNVPAVEEKATATSGSVVPYASCTRALIAAVPPADPVPGTAVNSIRDAAPRGGRGKGIARRMSGLQSEASCAMTQIAYRTRASI